MRASSYGGFGKSVRSLSGKSKTMTLPIDVSIVKVSAGLAVFCAVATGAVIAGLVVDDPAQADRKAKPARLRRKITFSVKLFMTKSFGRITFV